MVGRREQKARTRRALVDAARVLIGQGMTPSVEQAAAAASISRTTAYRYFANQEALLVAAFPGGSITGAPKRRAMEIIAELEPTIRGPYCGSLFYAGFDGTLDSNILIRTFTCRHGWVQCPVGGGIVHDITDPYFAELVRGVANRHPQPVPKDHGLSLGLGKLLQSTDQHAVLFRPRRLGRRLGKGVRDLLTPPGSAGLIDRGADQDPAQVRLGVSVAPYAWPGDVELHQCRLQ
jgi:hypothetical protein